MSEVFPISDLSLGKELLLSQIKENHKVNSDLINDFFQLFNFFVMEIFSSCPNSELGYYIDSGKDYLIISLFIKRKSLYNDELYDWDLSCILNVGNNIENLFPMEINFVLNDCRSISQIEFMKMYRRFEQTDFNFGLQMLCKFLQASKENFKKIIQDLDSKDLEYLKLLYL